MEPINGHIQIKPLTQGMISSSDGNEYEVVQSPRKYIEDKTQEAGAAEFREYDPGDIVIVEDDLVIKTSVNGEEVLFVKEDNIIARTYGPAGNSPNCTTDAGVNGTDAPTACVD